MAFLGHIISSEGIKVDPHKIVVIKNFPRWLNLTKIRILLGLVGYYMRFVY